MSLNRAVPIKPPKERTTFPPVASAPPQKPPAPPAWPQDKSGTHAALASVFKEAFADDPIAAVATLLELMASVPATYPRAGKLNDKLRHYFAAALDDFRNWEGRQ